MTDSNKPNSSSDESIEKRLAETAAFGKRMFQFHGRYSRKQFWLGALGLLGIMILMVFPLAAMNNPTGGSGGPAVLLLLSAPLLWIYCKLIVHRLHDLGWSGWWFVLLGPLLIPLPMWMWVEGHTQGAYDRGHDIWLEFGAYAIFLGGFILMGCVRGTEGPNKYGPDPTSPAPTTAPRA
jgi:uncharacterized membrane protein YhaH (DUF805 family)